MQERRNSIALAMELHLSCTNSSKWIMGICCEELENNNYKVLIVHCVETGMSYFLAWRSWSPWPCIKSQLMRDCTDGHRVSENMGNFGILHWKILCLYFTVIFHIHGLTHWGRDEIDAILQTIFSNAFSWMKMYELRFRFHWSLFLRFKLIFQHWFR